MNATAIIKQAKTIGKERLAEAKSAAAPTQGMQTKVAYVNESGEPLFTLDQALDMFAKVASLQQDIRDGAVKELNEKPAASEPAKTEADTAKQAAEGGNGAEE